MTNQGERERTYTMAALDLSGEWQTDLPDDATDVVAVVRVRTGKGLTEQPLTLADIAKGKISIEVAQPEMQHYKKMPQNRLKGRAIDAAGQAVAYLPIVGYAKEMHLPLFFTTTDSEGRFAIELGKEMPEQIVVSTLDGSSALVLTPKELADNANKILLFNIGKNTTTGDKSAAKAAGGADISEPITDPDDCACNGLISNTPRVPSTFTYANSNQFSQDINACEPLTTANRSVEEFKFYKIARTSQPVVRKFAFGKVSHQVPILKTTPADITTAIKVLSTTGALLGYAPPANTPADQIKLVWDNDLRPDGSQVWGISKIGGGADWASQEWDSAIDWTRGWNAGAWQATLHQATSFAFGRIFIMKQTISADGHSKGEVIGSDTLLPGEKRQKALLSWLCQESASRSESVEQIDSLEASLSRNRDVSEVVKGVVKENSSGRSNTNGDGDFGMTKIRVGIESSTETDNNNTKFKFPNNTNKLIKKIQSTRTSWQKSTLWKTPLVLFTKLKTQKKFDIDFNIDTIHPKYSFSCNRQGDIPQYSDFLNTSSIPRMVVTWAILEKQI
jgi:hypothetical protein